MQTVTKNLSELKCSDKNVRLHGDRQIKEYIRSIEMFGQLRPMVIDEDDVVLAGNGLLTALLQMGRENADCYVVTGLSAKQKKKLMLADNKIFELGVNDQNVFDELLRELGGDIDIPGYDEELLKVLTANAKEADEIINSYGTFSEEKVQEMKNSQSWTPQPQQPPSQLQSPMQETITRQIETPQNSQKYIVCPKCGEKIWL
ncbi:MAG: hypothetical protein II857_02795 [Selenomonadaceae bacterium]|nr:hypothetical protein [Selenomonadaceae bacterium]